MRYCQVLITTANNNFDLKLKYFSQLTLWQYCSVFEEGGWVLQLEIKLQLPNLLPFIIVKNDMHKGTFLGQGKFRVPQQVLSRSLHGCV